MFWLKPLIQQLIHSYIFAFIISKTSSDQWMPGPTRHKSFWWLDRNINVFHMQTSAFCTPKPPSSCLRIFLYYWQVRKCEARRNARSPAKIYFPFFMDGSQPIGATLHCSKIFPFFPLPPGFSCLEPITWKIRPFHWKAKPRPVDIFTMNWWPVRWNTYLNCLGAVCEVSLSKCLHTRLHIPLPAHHHQKKFT